MTRLIELAIKIITSLLLILLMVSCKYSVDFNGKSIKGSGNVITENRDLEKFTKIKVTSGIECELTQSDNQKVEVVADDNLIKGIKTRVENGELIIESDYNNYVNVESRLVKISIPTIEAIETTSGSSLLTKNTLKGTKIILDSSSGSELNASLEYETISTSSSSGSEQNLTGKALNLSTQSSSGSHISAKSLLANTISASSSSGSSIDIHPILKLNADASSGSSINYEGKPKDVKKDESSGGSINAE